MLIRLMFSWVRKHQLAIPLVCCTLLSGASSLVCTSVPPFGQQFGSSSASPVKGPTHATQVLGLEHVKRGAKGRLTVVGKALRFESGAAVATVSIASIQDVFTGEESQQLVRGKTGFVVEMAMPYESSRFVSLVASKKIDVLTLEYRDSNGGLHGVIFTLPKGQAPAVKRLLVAHGAHAGKPLGDIAKP
jgi:hypothetical protein